MPRTGEICTVSGIYRDSRGHEIPLSKGERFPPCATCGGVAVVWTLVRKA